MPHVEEGGIPGVMSPGVPPTNIRTYYQSQQPLAVSSSGSGAMPPSSVQIPVSAGMVCNSNILFLLLVVPLILSFIAFELTFFEFIR